MCHRQVVAGVDGQSGISMLRFDVHVLQIQKFGQLLWCATVFPANLKELARTVPKIVADLLIVLLVKIDVVRPFAMRHGMAVDVNFKIV